MSRPVFTLIVCAIVVIAFLAMWFGWRARSRRDASVLGTATAPLGELIAEFTRVFYVSTTPAGEPLARVAAPGLRYRGHADIAVREGGVTVQVAGEDPVHFAASQLRGSGSAGRRVGKAVEQDGLALMRWVSDARELESSFRFENRAEQIRFAEAIDRISPAETEMSEVHGTMNHEPTATEEGLR